MTTIKHMKDFCDQLSDGDLVEVYLIRADDLALHAKLVAGNGPVAIAISELLFDYLKTVNAEKPTQRCLACEIKLGRRNTPGAVIIMVPSKKLLSLEYESLCATVSGLCHHCTETTDPNLFGLARKLFGDIAPFNFDRTTLH